MKDRDKTPFENRFVIAEITDTALSHLVTSKVALSPAKQRKVKNASPNWKRTKPSNTVWGRLFQEAGHHCAFCSEKEVASLQIHHIDGNRSNNVIENLLMVCATCHAKITGGVVAEAEVRLKKRQLAMPGRKSRAFTSQDVKLMEGQFKHESDDPIDYDSFNLRPEDLS